MFLPSSNARRPDRSGRGRAERSGDEVGEDVAEDEELRCGVLVDRVDTATPLRSGEGRAGPDVGMAAVHPVIRSASVHCDNGHDERRTRAVRALNRTSLG